MDIKQLLTMITLSQTLNYQKGGGAAPICAEHAF